MSQQIVELVTFDCVGDVVDAVSFTNANGDGKHGRITLLKPRHGVDPIPTAECRVVTEPTQQIARGFSLYERFDN